MAVEDDEPIKRKPLFEKPLLDPLGVAELRAYVADLQTEIARAKAMIDRKSSDRSAAEAVFGRK